MNDITLLIVELILCIIMMIIIYVKDGTNGIFKYSVVALIVSSIFSSKMIEINGYNVNLGLIPFITIFTSFNIIIQKKGNKAPKPLMLTLISFFLISYIIMFLISFMNNSKILLFTSASYNNIFNNSIRIYFSILVSLLYALLLNNKIYFYLKSMKNNILVSNLFSTIIVHALSSSLFVIISNIFVNDAITIIKNIMIRYILSIIIGIICTIPIFITKYIKER